ncbi:MAG: hypothetical protein VB857_10200, partial [Pirellulaceae bacterium]
MKAKHALGGSYFVGEVTNRWSGISRWLLLGLTSGLSVLTGSFVLHKVMAEEPAGKAAAVKPTAEQLEFFRQQVKPILESRCIKCHGGEAKIRGKL